VLNSIGDPIHEVLPRPGRWQRAQRASSAMAREPSAVALRAIFRRTTYCLALPAARRIPCWRGTPALGAPAVASGRAPPETVGGVLGGAPASEAEVAVWPGVGCLSFHARERVERSAVLTRARRLRRRNSQRTWCRVAGRRARDGPRARTSSPRAAANSVGSPRPRRIHRRLGEVDRCLRRSEGAGVSGGGRICPSRRHAVTRHGLVASPMRWGRRRP
jgi:hypothetical protein